MEHLTLSRPRLETFLTCQRRFELRYLRRLPWPSQPLDAQTDARLTLGDQFHRLLERHFLGLPLDESSLGTETLRSRWLAFQQSGLSFKRFAALRPELTLTVPIGNFLLTGRFDLLGIEQPTGAEPKATLFDWKTGRPRSAARLAQDWQSKLYLAMLAESGGMLLENNGRFQPQNLSLTYWYVQEPTQPRTIQYSVEQHQANWGELQQIVAQIEMALTADEWPLTETLAHCAGCTYRVFCGRQETETAVSPPPLEEEDERQDEPLFTLEPHTP